MDVKKLSFERIAVWLLFLVAAGLNYRLACLIAINSYDEGLLAYGAARIMEGDVLYRDLWVYYAPGNYYLVAWLFKIFGPTVLVMRLWIQGCAVFLLLPIYLIVRKLVSWPSALMACLMVQVVLMDYFIRATNANPLYPALAISLLSCYFLLNFLSDGRRRSIIWCGLLAGLTVLFRHDTGAYTIVSQMFILIAYFMNRAQLQGKAFFVMFKEKAGLFTIYLVSILVVVVPVAVYFINHVGRSVLAYDFWTFPSELYHTMRSTLYPSLAKLCVPLTLGGFSARGFLFVMSDISYFYFPLLILLAALVVLGINGRTFRGKEFPAQCWGVLFITVFGVVGANYMAVRSDYAHGLPNIVVSVILFLLVVSLSSIPKSLKIFFWLVFSCVLFTFGCEVAMSVDHARFYVSGRYDIPAARGIAMWQGDSDYQDAIRHVQGRVPEDEKIFVGNVFHDRITINDVLFYFMSERVCATRYYDLHPGVATERRIQETIAKDIESQGVQYIVLWDNGLVPEPNESYASKGSDYLDKYIREHFKSVKVFGPYTIFRRAAGVSE